MDPTLGSLLTQLDAPQETEFQNWAKNLPWYAKFAETFGTPPDLNDEMYDYRRAFLAGSTPQPYAYDPSGVPHWPSKTPDGQLLKTVRHPTYWMELFMDKTGTDPNALGVGPEHAFINYLGK